MRTLLLSTVAFALAASAAAAADNKAETVVVTATRTAQPREVTGTSISVITADELKQLQITAVADALERTPGLTVVRNGGPGQTVTVGLRGASAGQTLMLIDGVRINDPSVTDGTALVGDVLVNNIERIEVLRGPQSTLYGSDAIGGVVNIISERGGDSPFAATATAEAGSFGTWHLNAAAHGTLDSVEYGAAANYFHTSGVSAADKRDGNPERDGYRNLGLTGNLRWHITDDVSLDLRSYYTDARNDFDGYPPPFYTFSDTDQYATNKLFSGYAGLNADFFGGMFHNRIAYIATRADRKSFNDPSFGPGEDFYAKGNSDRFEYQGVVDVDDANQATFGAETQRQSFDTLSAYDFPPIPTKGDARITSFYGQWQTKLFEHLTLTGGVRHDRHSDFGDHTSLKFTAAWQADENTTLRANYGDGFKAPTLYQLFSQYSNPVETLRPETAHGWEAGIDRFFLGGAVRASLTYYERRTKDQIDFFNCFIFAPPAECLVRPNGFYYNVGRVRARGFEFEAEARLGDDWSATASFTSATAHNEIADNALVRRPHVQASASLVYAPADWSVGASLRYVGKNVDQYNSFVVPPAPVFNDSHTLVDVTAEYDFAQWSVFGRVENLFDETYQPVLTYGAEGRGFFIGVRAKS